MSAKRGGPKPSPTASTAAASKPAVKVSAKSTDAAASVSDDPFDVAAPVTGKVIQLLPKPIKGRLHRISCPMCETPGFTSKKAAGKEVKCANRECLVPIFTAPALEQEKPAEPEAREKSGLGIVHYVVIALVAAAVLGGGAFYLTDDQPAGGGGQEFDPGTVAANPGTGPEVVPVDVPDGGEPDVVEPPEPLGPPAAELRAQALKFMDAYSLDAESNRKPYCRRLAAEAWALQGESGNAGVNKQLQQLATTGGSRMSYQRLLPLIEVAWQNMAAGKTDAATIVDEFPELIAKLPPTGMLALNSVTELAVLQVALDRMDDAVALIAGRANPGPLGQLMESLARARFTGRSFDQAVELRPALGWSNPQTVAVTVGLTARGLSDKALAWAGQATNKTECTSAWAEASILRAGSAAPLNQIRQQGQSLSPADQVRFLSRVGMSLHAVGATAEAKAVLVELGQKLAALGTPPPMKRPSLKEQRNYSPPDPSALRNAALAALDVAQLELALNGPDAAWKTVQTAMTQTRGMSPSLTDARQPFGEIGRIGDAGVTQQLRVLHGLLTDDDAKNAFVSYQTRCQRLLRSAADRFALQEGILQIASEWGLADQVWVEIRTRGSDGDPSQNEPWFETNLASVVHDWFKQNQQEDQRAEVERLATPARPKDNRRLAAPRYATGLVVAQLLSEGNVTQLANLLERFASQFPDERDRRWQQETILQSASHLVQTGKHKEALSFAEALRDLQIRSEVCELVGAEITASGERELVLNHVKFTRMAFADRVALLHGFIARLPDDPPPPTPSDEPASET